MQAKQLRSPAHRMVNAEKVGFISEHSKTALI